VEEKYDKFLTSMIKVMRSMKIYPPGHHVIEDDLEATFHMIEELLKSRPTITVAVKDQEILVEGKLLREAFLKIKPLLREFGNKDIDSVTFLRGISKDEVRSFMEILVQRPQRVTEGGMAGPAIMADIKHVKVNQIHYKPVLDDEIDRT
jgi:hypothetical protein